MLTLAAMLMIGQCPGPGCEVGIARSAFGNGLRAVGSGFSSMLFPRRMNIAPPTTTWGPYISTTETWTSPPLQLPAYSYAAPASTYATPTYSYASAYPPAAPAYAYASPQSYSYAPAAYSYPATSTPTQRTVYSTPAPPKHRAYDCDGQAWTYSDPDYLRAFIAGRDSVLKSSRQRVITRTSARTQGEPCPAGCSCTTPGDCGNSDCNCTTPPAH